MLNDLWNNSIMMSLWQTDLSQRQSRVMDMSKALATGERMAGGGEGEGREEKGRMDSNLSYVIHLDVYPEINAWEMSGLARAVVNLNNGFKVATAC